MSHRCSCNTNTKETLTDAGHKLLAIHDEYTEFLAIISCLYARGSNRFRKAANIINKINDLRNELDSEFSSVSTEPRSPFYWHNEEPIVLKEEPEPRQVKTLAALCEEKLKLK